MTPSRLRCRFGCRLRHDVTLVDTSLFFLEMLDFPVLCRLLLIIVSLSTVGILSSLLLVAAPLSSLVILSSLLVSPELADFSLREAGCFQVPYLPAKITFAHSMLAIPRQMSRHRSLIPIGFHLGLVSGTVDLCL